MHAVEQPFKDFEPREGSRKKKTPQQIFKGQLHSKILISDLMNFFL